MNLSTRLVNSALGLIWRSAFSPAYSPAVMRKALEALAGVAPAKLLKKYPGLKIYSFEHEGLPMESLSTARGSKKTILYLHGGGFFMGSINAYRKYAMRLAYSCQSEVVSINYRLAPEHPFPAALEDAVKAYRYLLGSKHPRDLVIAGDSAGGGLTVATLLYLRDHNIPLPSCAVSISPWADLTAESETIKTNDKKDVWLRRRHYETWAPLYAPDRTFRNPLVSPVFGDLSGLPRLLILVGDQETILGDSIKLHQNAIMGHVECTLDIGKDMQHVWMIALPFLKDSKRAMRAIAKFVLHGT